MRLSSFDGQHIGSGPFGGRFPFGIMWGMCSIEYCDDPVIAWGWCNRHYRRWKKHGNPTKVISRHQSVHGRFWSRINQNGPDAGEDLGRCWVWTGKPNAAGYGVLSDTPGREGADEYAHRFAYRLLVGPCPSGMELDHLCRNRLCVKPWHLEPVTHAENVRRGDAVKAHCPHGHEYTETNTYHRPSGGKVCRTCAREQARINYRKRKARQP